MPSEWVFIPNFRLFTTVLFASVEKNLNSVIQVIANYSLVKTPNEFRRFILPCLQLNESNINGIA